MVIDHGINAHEFPWNSSSRIGFRVYSFHFILDLRSIWRMKFKSLACAKVYWSVTTIVRALRNVLERYQNLSKRCPLHQLHRRHSYKWKVNEMVLLISWTLIGYLREAGGEADERSSLYFPLTSNLFSDSHLLPWKAHLSNSEKAYLSNSG